MKNTPGYLRTNSRLVKERQLVMNSLGVCDINHNPAGVGYFSLHQFLQLAACLLLLCYRRATPLSLGGQTLMLVLLHADGLLSALEFLRLTSAVD